MAINSRVAWVGPRGDLAQAVFTATVIASRGEQDQFGLNPPPARSVPVMRRGDLPILDGPGLDPPSQPELNGVPPLVAQMDDHHAELERSGKHGSQIDPETGEIIDPSKPELKREGE